MGKIVNLSVCNVQYCAFLENQFHVMGAMLCCWIQKCWLSSCQLFHIHGTKTFPALCNGSAFSAAADITGVDRNTHCFSPQDRHFPALGMPPSPRFQKRIIDKNPSRFSRLNQCLQKTFSFSEVYPEEGCRARNRWRERTKDRGNPARKQVTSWRYAHLMNRGPAALKQRPSCFNFRLAFQGCWCSEQPWKIKTVSLCGRMSKNFYCKM